MLGRAALAVAEFTGLATLSAVLTWTAGVLLGVGV